MVCKNCGNQLGSSVKFCGKCGYVVEDFNEKINDSFLYEDLSENTVAMQSYCANCGSILAPDALFCRKCGASVNAKPEKKTDSVQRKDKSVYILIGVLIAVIIAAVGTVFAVYKYSKSDMDIKTTEVNNTVEKETESSEESETPGEKETDTPSRKEPDNVPDNVHDESDNDSFSFSYGQLNVNGSPTYKRVENSNYSFYCAVPEHFVNGGEGVYYAPDNTAIMKIDSKANISGWSLENVMQQYIQSVGGEVTYSANGETWFAVSMEKDGVAYYKKCFVDHYIRSFSFEFPKEYLEIYDEYINYIEDNFKRTDV